MHSLRWFQALFLPKHLELFLQVLQFIILTCQFLLLGLEHGYHLETNTDLIFLGQSHLELGGVVLLGDSGLALAAFQVWVDPTEHVTLLRLELGEPVCLFWFLLCVLKDLLVPEFITTQRPQVVRTHATWDVSKGSEPAAEIFRLAYVQVAS